MVQRDLSARFPGLKNADTALPYEDYLRTCIPLMEVEIARRQRRFDPVFL